MYTNQENPGDKPENNEHEVVHSIQEERKGSTLQRHGVDWNVSESRPATDCNIQFDDNEEEKEHIDASDNITLLNKLKNTLKQRKRYKANWIHKIFTVFPSCMWKYKGIIRK